MLVFGQDLCSCLALDFFGFDRFFLLLLWMPLRVWVTLVCVSLGHFACADNKGTFLLAELDPREADWLCIDLGDPKIPIIYVLYFYAPMVQPQSHCQFPS